MTKAEGFDRIEFYCNVKLNYLLQRLTSFGAFPVDKFAKAPQPRRIMKEIKYKNKTIKLPFNGADYGGDDALEPVTIKNRFTGQETSMPTFAAAVYDVIIGSEMIASQEDKRLGDGGSKQWDNVRKGLDWFKRHFAEQYMVVLD